MSENKQIQRRDGTFTDEITNTCLEVDKHMKLVYEEYFYLDYEVDEDTGMIGENLAPFYKKNQVSRTLKNQKAARDLWRDIEQKSGQIGEDGERYFDDMLTDYVDFVKKHNSEPILPSPLAIWVTMQRAAHKLSNLPLKRYKMMSEAGIVKDNKRNEEK